MEETLSEPVYLAPEQAAEVRASIRCLVIAHEETARTAPLIVVKKLLELYAVLPQEGLQDFPDGDIALLILP